jgi:hypothetical protein
MSHRGGRSGCLTVAIILATTIPVYACDFLVRDAAFRAERDVHRLCLIAATDDTAAEQIASDLSAWLAGDAADLNVQLERVDVNDPAVEWSRYGIPSAPPSAPVVALVGTNHETGRSFVIDHWEPSPTRDELNLLLHSPTRAKLQEELGRNLAVVLFARCTNCDLDAVAAMLQQSADHWKEKAELGVSVVEIDRSDPAERLLLRFAGLRPEGPSWVGVVFARGKLMNPPLVGEEITPDAVDELVKQVLAECACSKPLPSIGVDLPLVWPAVLDEAVIELSTPDATTIAAMNEATGPARLVPMKLPAAVNPSSVPASVPEKPGRINVSAGGEVSLSTLGIAIGALGLVVIVWTLFRRHAA